VDIAKITPGQLCPAIVKNHAGGPWPPLSYAHV